MSARKRKVRLMQWWSADTLEVPSAAPAGTVFKGLSILKDRADPVARPDSEYPPWLWALLDDPAIKSSKVLSAGDVDTTGMSKGEARAALKRGAKAARAAVKKAAAAEARAAARAERAGVNPAAATHAAADAELEQDKQPRTPAEKFEAERQARRSLRKQNRDAIKAANFVKST